MLKPSTSVTVSAFTNSTVYNNRNLTKSQLFLLSYFSWDSVRIQLIDMSINRPKSYPGDDLHHVAGVEVNLTI